MNGDTATPARAPDARWSRRILWIGGVLIGVIVALATYHAVRGYQAAARETARELDAQARVIAGQTARSLEAVDRVLGDIVGEYRRGSLAGIGADELEDVLRARAVGLVQVEAIAVTDAEGRLVASSIAEPDTEAPRSLANQPVFQALRNGTRSDLALDASAPALLHPGHRVFPIARRLQTPAGAFAGVVVAAGRVDYFQDFYRDVRLGAGTNITLLHRNGTVVARFPPAEAALGRRFPRFEELLATRGDGREVSTPEVSIVDGVERFGALELVPGYPLAVFVTRDRAIALAAWREQTLSTALGTLGLCALAAWSIAGLRRQLVRLDKTRGSLERSRERFALAAAGADVGIWDWDVGDDSIFASPRAREIFGLAPGPESQDRAAWFAAVQVHPDDRGARIAAIEAHLAGVTPSYELEYRVRRRQGEYGWIRVRGLCVRDSSGAPLRIAGSVADIDSRKRAEDSLRLSEERYALAMTGSTNGHWVWDVASDALFVSDAINELFGVPQGTPAGSREAYFEHVPVHPDDLQRVMQIGPDVRSGRLPRFEIEYRILRAGGGEPRWILTRAQSFSDADGRVVRVAGVSVDITERKRTEEALRLSEERFALAVAGSDDGVWDFDYVSRRAFASRRGRQLLGMSLEPEIQPLEEWFAQMQLHPDDAPRRLAAMQAHLDGKSSAYEGEWRARQPDGSYRWVRVRGVCVRDAAGKPLRMAGSVSDIDARKRAEESLRQSQDRYALAVAGSDDGVWDWDYVAGVAFESARARELQGLPPGPELQPLDELVQSLRVHPDDAPRRAEGLRAHLAGETAAYECEYRVRHDSGDYRWIRVRALCIRDDASKPCRMAGSVSDIDARKRAEEALRQSEERFALAVAGSNDGILDWDIVNDRMYISERALSIVGIDPEAEVRSRADWASLVMPRFHPDDVRRLSEELHGAPNEPAEAHEGEYRVRHGDGRYRWTRFRGKSVRDESGRAIRWAGSLSDIDAEKQTKEALRRSEERYQLAVAGSNEGLWDWDLKGDSLFLSPRAQELLWLEPGEPQRPRREWIGLTKYHPDDVAEVRTAISAHLRGESGHFKVEYRLRHHSGAWRWYRQRGVAVRDAAGRPTRMAGSMEDITDRKDAEAERERLEVQLRQAQKLEAIGTLAGGIAHDFNNILAAILGYGEMARKDAAEGSAQSRHIDAALSAGLRAKSLVERILAFSRSGMGDRHPVHVQSVVVEALEVIAASLPAGITLERRLDAGDAAVLGDPTQVHQVVVNLCANAVQAMKASGTLTVTLERIELNEPHCATNLLAGGSYVCLSVRDSGSGIAPQVLERIFDPFFTTKEIGVGTGLGLSLVHGIVTDLGGGIRVESRVGDGSTFTVYLPWQSSVAAPQDPPRAALPNGRGETILLIDDEEPLVRLGEEMIAQLGYEPVGFTSSTVALATFRAEPQRFNAVLSDEAMPEMTGSELIREIRKIRPDIPIVLMSGYVTTALASRARDAGVAQVLSKPLVSTDIARSLASALQH